ncbi:MAG: SHD1 domain-containing protein, partial [Verrucomicrobiota bacterium]
DMMPDLDAVTVFGSGQTIGNDLEGTFYDFKRDRRGKPLSVGMSPGEFGKNVANFIKNGWKPSSFARFYRAPKKLYTPTIMIPPTLTYFSPFAFNEFEMRADMYLVHYKGQLVHPKGGRFRFWGMGDAMLVVRVDGKVVFDFLNSYSHVWHGKRSRKSGYHLGHWPSFTGQWIDLEPGIPLPMEVIIGEGGGGLTAAMLCVEEEGVEYPRNLDQGPLLPIFKTAELSRDQVDAIFELLPENMCAVTNGPVFSDYDTSGEALHYSPEKEEVSAIEPHVEEASESGIRQWTLDSGKVVEAEFVMEFGDKVVLKTTRGRQVKILVSEFSAEDLDYLELASPPSLKITFLKETGMFDFKILPFASAKQTPIMRELTAGLKIEKINMKPYTKKLKVELFSIAQEIDGDNYVLLDRKEGTFIPSEENDGCYELWGKKAYMKDYHDTYAPPLRRRGLKYKGHMILVIDERGKIIAQDISNDWMLDIIDFLREFPVGRHFSKKGQRVYPPRGSVMYSTWNDI